jgi:hypothetical protein
MHPASEPQGKLAGKTFPPLRLAAQAAGKWCAENTPGRKIKENVNPNVAPMLSAGLDSAKMFGVENAARALG